MTEGKDLAFQPPAITAGGALSIQQMQQNVAFIQDAMKKALKVDTHFGVIPGTKKPALYKAGAEKLCLLTGLRGEFQIDRDDLPGGHREYTVRCDLVRTETGELIAQGVGFCSSMESKYRYRWRNGERVENADPADVYNTILKMAKKRAHVDGTLTALGASDMFEQDVDDMPPEDIKPRRGKPSQAEAVVDRNQGDELDAESQAKRDQLIADLEAKAGEGMDALLEAWGKLSADDRTLVGAAFGKIKAKAGQ